jgi:hypothetical protein
MSEDGETEIHRTVILCDVLNEFETWSLTLKEGHRLRVFENRVLRGVFGSERDEVTGDWRKLRNEELSYLYYLPVVINRTDAMGGA